MVARFAVALALVAGCAQPDATPVRATLADGQVLVGQVRTDTLLLEGGLGTLEVPLADVGEVVPVEGSELGASGGYATVWLRNGTELRGRWTDPELAMGIAVGGRELAVDLPVQDLVRFQLQGGEIWPDQPVFRVRTTWGDDVLVDPERSTITLVNELGTFEPSLTECAAITPGPDGWTVVLHTGTVLRGEIEGDSLQFALELGPETVDVPLDAIVGMTWESWAVPAYASTPMATPLDQAGTNAVEPAPARSPEGAGGESGWFRNDGLRDLKR